MDLFLHFTCNGCMSALFCITLCYGAHSRLHIRTGCSFLLLHAVISNQEAATANLSWSIMAAWIEDGHESFIVQHPQVRHQQQMDTYAPNACNAK